MTHPSAFISYSHDSPEHGDHVLALADRLRRDGIDCVLDQYETAPPEGWTMWMDRQIRKADFVLMVCTETYYRRVMGEEEPGAGLGVKWEGNLIYQRIYDADAQNTRFIPVVFEAAWVNYIPGPLKATTYYLVDTQSGYEDLYRRLTGQPEVEKPDLGVLKKLAPRERKSDFLVGQPAVVGAPVVERQQPIEPELILIPAGEFLMGSDPSKVKNAPADEQPQHLLHLPDYYIAKAPLTNAEYAAFVEASDHRRPNHWKGGKPPEGKDHHPVVYVTWHDAVAYCQWLAETTGKAYRLPSEAEWEKAARGGLRIGSEDNPYPDRVYPWRNEWDDKLCNSREGGPGGTTPVGHYSPGGDSPYSCVDMPGNVWEWTLSLYKDYRYDPEDGREDPEASGSRVLRGGSWNDNRRRARVSCRYYYDATLYSKYAGFRLCVAAQPG